MKQSKEVRNAQTEKNHAQGKPNIDVIIKNLKPTKLSAFISELDISTDTIVAKVRLVTNNATRRIWVYWGDLESDEISVYPGICLAHSPEFGLPISLPNRTYEIFHVYDEPKDCRTFKKNVKVRIQDHSGRIDQSSQTITLTA